MSIFKCMKRCSTSLVIRETLIRERPPHSLQIGNTKKSNENER